jgi:hypothetical protein
LDKEYLGETFGVTCPDFIVYFGFCAAFAAGAAGAAF